MKPAALIAILLLLCASHAQPLVNPYAFSGVSAPTPDILWWKLNNGSGATITATVGVGGTTDADWVTGKSGSGSALDFVPANSDNSTSDSTVTYGASVITVTFWAWFDSTSAVQLVAESTGDPVNDSHWWSMAVLTDGTLIGYIRGSGTTGARQESIAVPGLGSWNHYAFVCDNSSTTGDIKAYLNGASQSTTVVQSTKAGSGNFSVHSLNLASRSGTSLFLDGRLDDFRIYAGELSGAQITAVMNDPQ